MMLFCLPSVHDEFYLVISGCSTVYAQVTLSTKHGALLRPIAWGPPPAHCLGPSSGPLHVNALNVLMQVTTLKLFADVYTQVLLRTAPPTPDTVLFIKSWLLQFTLVTANANEKMAHYDKCFPCTHRKETSVERKPAEAVQASIF